MQIIGGKLKGKKLAKCNLKSIRPAMALIRKSIFDTLQDFVCGASVLDLYAGSGIVGIECLSRGAKELTLVEADKNAAWLIKKNLSLCDLEAQIILGRLPKALTNNYIKNKSFDLIFIDPPYGNSNNIHEIIELILNHKILISGGLIIIESEAKSDFAVPDKLELYKEKRFGNTKVTYIRS